MIEVESYWHSGVVVDGDNQLLVFVAVVDDLEVVDAGALVSVDGLHEHGPVRDAIAVGGRRALDVDVAKAG